MPVRASEVMVVALALAACGSERPDVDGGPAVDGGGDAPEPADVSGPSACQLELAARGVSFARRPWEPERPDGRPELLCLVDDPILIQPVIGSITFHPDRLGAPLEPLFVTCSLGLAIEQMARMLAARGVTDVVHFGSYGCRDIAGTDVLSEHARARALDVAAVGLADGTQYTVLTDWEKDQPVPTTSGGRFLREVVTSLFDQGVFNTILTPDFNADHRNHFHFDLTPERRFLR